MTLRTGRKGRVARFMVGLHGSELFHVKQLFSAPARSRTPLRNSFT
jgi:hypothetical protein